MFNRLSGEQAALQQFSYILANLLGLALAMYKCHTMGLLPTAQSDWVEFMDQQQVMHIHILCCNNTIHCYIEFGVFIWWTSLIMTSRILSLFFVYVYNLYIDIISHYHYYCHPYLLMV